MTQTKTVFAISGSVITILAVMLSISHFQFTTAQSLPTGNNVYVFAEGVSPKATFQFRDATVTYEFQGYTTTSNLLGNVGNFQARPTSPEFTLQRIVGDTPYLHKAVDQSFEYNGRTTPVEYSYREFDVTVELIQAGSPMRIMEYNDCYVSNYKITAEFDKEEGYTTGGKTGFAELETYTFTCNGLKPKAPLYDELIKEKQNPLN